MPFQLSPGVNITEIDLTTVVPSVATSDGAIGGVFRWGPIDQRVLVVSENDLVNKFGKPTNFNAETFFTAANFLSYGNRLYVSRAADTTGTTPSISVAIANTTVGSNVFYANTIQANLQVGMYVMQASNERVVKPSNKPVIVSVNSTAFVLSNSALDASSVTFRFGRPEIAYTAMATDGTVADVAAQIVKNKAQYEFKDGTFDSDVYYVAKYPGEIGNSLKISVVDNAASYQSNISLANVATGSSVGGNLTIGVGKTFGRIVAKQQGSGNSVAISDVKSKIISGDKILVGNSTIGTQYLTVSSDRLSVNSASFTANVTVSGSAANSTAGVNSTTYFITANNIYADGRILFDEGDYVTYANTAGDAAIGGLTTGTTYIIATANTTGFKLNTTSGDLVAVSNTATATTHKFTSPNVSSVSVGLSNLSNTSLINAVASFVFANNKDASSKLVLNSGDYVIYANAAGNSAIGGLVSGSTYLVANANTSGFKLAIGDVANVVALNTTGITTNTTHTFTTNTATITYTVNFEEPYRLRKAYTSNTISRYWEFFNIVENAPGQSDYQLFNGNTSASDELHIVVSDADGLFTGTPGTILETYQGLSRSTDAKNADGSTNYYKDVINESSAYIWWANDRGNAVSSNGLDLTSSTNTKPLTLNMKYGADGSDETNAGLDILGAAYDLFASPEDIDISLVLQGRPIGGTTVSEDGSESVENFELANYIIDNICEARKDCVALISPPKNLVHNNVGNEAVSLVNWRSSLHSTSYAVLDSGYKYQYDRYNDIYRWLPLNGDIAGLCVRTDNSNDAWWSPAGFNRGQIKNIVKLAWNPRKAERDVLYSNGINPVVAFPGQGTVLFGDKTLLAKPSAFDRINVRRLFIVLEKAISTSAKFSLFEFNDAFTRAQFKNLVTPYLRNVQGRRGITDFLVVCDDTNNTAQVIDSNQFVGDIYIKPARSINFIQLNFVAVGSGVQFSEVVGKF
jgi:hypothetical protein